MSVQAKQILNMTDESGKSFFELLHEIRDIALELQVDIRGDNRRGIKGLIHEKENIKSEVKKLQNRVNGLPDSELKKNIEKKIENLEESYRSIENEILDLSGKVERVQKLPGEIKTLMWIVLSLVIILGGVIGFFSIF